MWQNKVFISLGEQYIDVDLGYYIQFLSPLKMAE